MRSDGLEYVRNYYAVPAYKGVKVTAYGKSGVIVGGDGQYVKILLDGDKFARPYHPTDSIEYHVEPPPGTRVWNGKAD